jgi:serine/threonine protein kinase
MTDKNEEREKDQSRENPINPPDVARTVDFGRSETLVGQTLDGRFLIEKDLTEGGADAGGFGLIYLARDVKLMGREVVVKILQKAKVQNKDVARKFQHEKEALIRLDHPNIVRILDSGTLSDGNPFMVMEFIEGYSLRRRLREKGKLSFDEAAHIIEKVTDALGTAHSKKILHRDIKPENIMLTPQEEGFDRVRLIDFGIARVEDSRLAPATEIPRGIGTVLYIAPEQLYGQLEQTPAVDIYSFAIVIYEMLTGKLPFNPQSIIEMFELQKQGVKIPPSKLRADLPEAAEKLILSALEFEAEKRPQNARQFGRDLANILRGNASSKTDETNQNLVKTLPANLISQEIPTEIATKPAIEAKTDDSNIKITEPFSKKSNKTLIWALLGLLILAAISLPVGLAIWKSGEETAANDSNTNTNSTIAENEPSRELVYFLYVQKMRGGKPFEEPFKSSGQEIFESGYKFKMNFAADADGFMYIFNETKNANGKTIYNILYPTPKIKNGSAEIKAKEQIETGQNEFGGERGTEIVWLIWTKEAARTAAFDGEGAIKDEKNARQLSDFLQKYAKEKNEAVKDTANRQTVVKGKGDIIAHRIELEHR